MTEDNCKGCSLNTKEDPEEDRLQRLEELIHDLLKENELISRKVVLALRARKIRPDTVILYLRELLVADVVIAAHQRVGKLHPPDLQELERLTMLLGAIGGSNEALGAFLTEHSIRLRNAVMEKMKNADIVADPMGLMGSTPKKCDDPNSN